MAFLKYAHDQERFLHLCDENFFQFIRQQINLQFLSIKVLDQRLLHDSLFLEFLDRVVDAILVRETVKHLNLIVNIEAESRDGLNVLFYNCLIRLNNLPLILNGIPIDNVLGDLRVTDDSVFGARDNAIRLRADKNTRNNCLPNLIE